MIIDFDDPTIITNDFQTVGSNGLIVGNNDLKSLVRKKSLVQKVSVVMNEVLGRDQKDFTLTPRHRDDKVR